LAVAGDLPGPGDYAQHREHKHERRQPGITWLAETTQHT
jgi:hypothetical protein